MSRFDDALTFALRWEGGYVNDPDDRGGATNRGVTQGTYDAYRKSKGLALRSVRELTDTEMRQIYIERYWTPASCGAMEWPLAVVHFDLAVNGGVARAREYLQKALGVKVDRKIGPATLEALKHADHAAVARKYLDLRQAWYHRIAVGNQRKFLQGWLNRVAALRLFIQRGPRP